MEIDRIRLPFEEQIEFFRQKLNLPTAAWDDILKAAHDRAFIVAGVMDADLLDDLRKAVDAGIAGGDTIQDFRKKFKTIVQKHGWHGWAGEGSKAGEAWRTKVIYNTNIASSYAAGRWQQLNDPDLLKLRPYWRYVHNDSTLTPRPHHKAWGDSGLTLPHDHPFWQTHFPPNGWGCRCRVTAVKGPGENDSTEPPQGWDTRNEKGQMPGIDTGWDYAPGANTDMPLRQMVQDKLVKLPEAIGKALSHDVNKYITAREDVAGFILDALHNDKTGELWLGFVENKMIGQVAGVELSNYLVLIPPDAARHVTKTHGMDGGAQRPPKPEDYALASEWLKNPDNVKPGTDQGPNGEKRVKVTKTIGGETYESVWEVRPGKRNRALALISLWVKR